MLPVSLDFLTIFFIAAGFLLLGLNLRAWRKKQINITLMKDDDSQDEFDT